FPLRFSKIRSPWPQSCNPALDRYQGAAAGNDHNHLRTIPACRHSAASDTSHHRGRWKSKLAPGSLLGQLLPWSSASPGKPRFTEAWLPPHSIRSELENGTCRPDTVNLAIVEILHRRPGRFSSRAAPNSLRRYNHVAPVTRKG